MTGGAAHSTLTHLSAQIPSKADLKQQADAAVDKAKAKSDEKADQAKADQKTMDARAKVDAKADGVPMAADKCGGRHGQR